MSGTRQPGWGLALCRAAGEAGGSFRGLSRPGAAGGSYEHDPERSQLEAVRRARAKLRRYAAANRLNRLGTLTYAGEGCHDAVQVRTDVGRFFRRLRRGLGGERFPYLWVPELHASGHGFHLHFAVGQYVPRSLIVEAWGLGFVHIRLIGDLLVGSTARREARAAAGYVSKYLGKDFSGGGLNRYDVAKGFQPKTEPITGRSIEEVTEEASERMGGPPDVLLRPDEQEGWRGPPSVWMQWP